MSSKEGPANQRRSLFPKSYSKKESRKEKHVSFSPYARCLKMEPKNLTDEEKSSMWWQKPDYEGFARVGKIISKAILEGGSEIWLQPKSAPSSPRKEGNENDCESINHSPATTKDDCMIESLSSSSSVANAPLHHDLTSESSSQEFCEIRQKWWHKFGHSRRGLEHIASNAEGRQRHLNGRSAVQSVLKEQERQMMFLPKGYADVDKFRTVYLRETQWARILARAAGESDADAVQTNFDESRRKPREYYLRKHFDNNSDFLSAGKEINLPVFMEATISPKHSTRILNLDANTASQICFRNSQVLPASSKLKKHDNNTTEDKRTTKTPKKSPDRGPSTFIEEKKSESDDANSNDDATSSSTSSEDSSSSLAKMAAGWGVEEAQEDMSSVLIGMGVTPKPNITVG